MPAAIILAAGASSRLGRPKQLLVSRGKTLLRHAVDEALAAGAAPVLVVLGAFSERIRPTLETAPALVVQNADWQAGMGTSVRAGLQALLQAAPDVEATFLLLCDQPHVTGSVLRALEDAAQQTGKGLVACAYADTLGVPLRISRAYFGTLDALPDAAGAKQLLLLHPDDVASLPFPAGAFDIDLAADLDRLAH